MPEEGREGEALSGAHRERLLEAMTSVAARQGYLGASVASVVAQAGVSRATFYEQFANREECFSAAYDEILDRVRAALGSIGAGASFSDRWRRRLERTLSAFAKSPAGARLLLVEAEVAQPVRERHDRSLACLEAAIAKDLDVTREGPDELQIPAAALLGGIVGVTAMRVFSGQTNSLAALADELGAWMCCYRLQPGEVAPAQEHWYRLGIGLPASPVEPRTRAPTLLPRGSGALAAAEANRVRRERIIAATAAGVAECGYASLTVADIVARARVTRGVFYSSFRSKEDAFRAVQTSALQASIAAAASEFFAVPEWPERVWNAGAALLGYIAANPDLAYVGIVESNAAGDESIIRQDDARSAFTIFLEQGYESAHRPPPRIASDAIAWGVHALIRREVLAGRTTEMHRILPATAYTILAPFIGPSAALSFVEEKSRSALQGPRSALEQAGLPQERERNRTPVDRG